MTTHLAIPGFRFGTLFDSLRASDRRVLRTTPAIAHRDWLTRLALWAERQPMHHRMGSYMHRR